MKQFLILAVVIVAPFTVTHAWALCASPPVSVAMSKAFDARRYLEVVEKYATEEDDPGVLVYRAEAQVQRHRYREAHADFIQAYALAPSFSEVAHQLGLAELRGYSGSANVERGLSLLDIAANEGCDDAQFAASLYRLQRTRGRDREAFGALERLSTQGHRAAALLVGQLYRQGAGVRPDASKAYEHYLRAAQAGDAVAQYEIGTALRFGVGVDKDPDAANTWLDRARAQGEPRAHWRRGLDLMAEQQARAAHYEYWLSASGGFLSGQINLAAGLLNGVGARQDFGQAAYWLHQASNAPLAQAYLGDLYVQGIGVDHDLSKAFDWYERASAVMPAARAITSKMLWHGIGVAKDTERANDIEASLASESDPETLRSLADVYSTHPILEIRRPQQGFALAQRAYEAAPSSATADTLATAYAAVGAFKEAVEYARIALADETDLLNRPGLQARLEAFQDGQAWDGLIRVNPVAPIRTQTQRETAVFTGEFVGVFQRTRQSPAGINLDQPGEFGVTVIVESIAKGALPQRLSETLHLYIHSPTHFFARLASQPATLTAPAGRFQFTLYEVESTNWHHELEFQPQP